MPILNNSVPYIMRVEGQRHSYNPISFEYYVGGVSSHNTDKVELGQYPFI